MDYIQYFDENNKEFNFNNKVDTNLILIAKYVYKILWGSYTAGRAVPTEITLRGVKSDFDSIGIGARINCRGDGPENHSMILLDKDDYGVTIYDANWDNKCGVDVRTYSYSDFATTMWRIKTTSYTP